MPTRRYALALLAAFGASTSALAASPFSFEEIDSLEAMQSHLRKTLSVGVDKDRVRSMFVQTAGATLKLHPSKAGVEKYLYDINLCGWYVWRWNISADYDAGGKAKQLYVNGEPVFADGSTDTFDPARLKRPGTQEAIWRKARPRPEASKGESSLASIVYDLDADPATIDDQQLVGGGPSRVDPINMGRMHMYKVDPWRSIFDPDDADRIADYKGDCIKVDAAMNELKAKGGR